MSFQKKNHPAIKSKLHSRNRFNKRYDFTALVGGTPELSQFVKLNKYQDASIDFANPDAVLCLNMALLKYHYQIENWNVPVGYLCPPIPGRSDYIHYAADLLGSIRNNNKPPKGSYVKCLDIGTGVNFIYPIIGVKEYGWSFVASDIDKNAIDNAERIINSNSSFKGRIELRLQQDPNSIFKGIIKKDELLDITICNPPFYKSQEASQKETLRKLKNLSRKKVKDPVKNFGGASNELWCQGGELAFIQKLILESKAFSTSCMWFTSLVSKRAHITILNKILKDVEPVETEVIPMGQGNKKSRILAWTFLTEKQRRAWAKARWH